MSKARVMIQTSLFSIDLSGSGDALWQYRLFSTGAQQALSPPAIEIDGKLVLLACSSFQQTAPPIPVGSKIVEHRFTGVVDGEDGLFLTAVFRTSATCPFVRFRYELSSSRTRRITKTCGGDNLTYFTTDLSAFSDYREIRFSEFNDLYHSFGLTESEIDDRHFDNGVSFMGPILAATTMSSSTLLAYEHGSQLPDRFVEFTAAPDGSVSLRAVKGSYYNGQEISTSKPYRTIWMQLGMSPGNMDLLASEYRSFVLNSFCPNSETRKPYVFYNTWNFQERNQDWNKQTYLSSMNETRILDEIDMAHRMGVDVFVLDTGWYEKTGDWKVSSARFPNGLAPIKQRLDDNGMKLGLWFNPLVAAMSSSMRKEYGDCLMTRDGKASDPDPIWETEASQWLCLVSRYKDAFADELVRLYHEVGVRYYKWDAIGQYGCADPGHHHGTVENSTVERSESYAFQLGEAMAYVVERLTAECPDVIVDFDITEGGRSVGLSFLSVGKYFLINNGPYYENYNVPVPPARNVNLFFFPGPARAWICRSALSYDRWIPSILFLTHYFPDDPAENQLVTIASLMLGQNGIWGDLLSVTNGGVERIGDALRKYKMVRDDVTSADPIRSGHVGGSPEVHEKVAANGKGVVCIFASAAGTYDYVTKNKVVTEFWSTEGTSVVIDNKGRAVIKSKFDRPSACFVIFGTK